MRRIQCLAVSLLLSVPALGIELSLEENRGQRGSVGFVDMQRLFSNSPDAQRAREAFDNLVRQAEERVNLRKAELLKLRQELAAAQAERDALAQSATQISTTVVTAPMVSSAAALTAPTPAPPVTTISHSSPTVREPALPGMSSAEAPSASSSPATPVASSPVAPAPSAAAPAAPPPPPGPSSAQRLLEIDGRIIQIQAAITHKESELLHEHDESDQGLLDVESRKTDQVLARLYRAVSEIARREGISVVVDKTTILYGQPAVDLTDKVLKLLKENQSP